MSSACTKEDHDGPRTSSSILLEYVGQGLFFYVALYGSYVQVFHVLPHQYGDDPQSLLCQRLLILYLLLQVLVNWYLVRRNNALYRQNHGVPQQILEFQLAGVDPRTIVRTPLMWKYCKSCRKWAPPRSHHCKICDRCILKRDHHCYFTSTCIGYSNQRFFIVMIFYWICCVTYLPSLYRYLYTEVQGYQMGYSDLILPVALLRSVFGTMPGVYANILVLLWGSPTITILAPSLLYDQLKELYTGLTPFELENGIRLTPKTSKSELFKEIFGKYWWLNFIMPVHWLFPSDCDGINWKNHRVLEAHEVVQGHGHSHGGQGHSKRGQGHANGGQGHGHGGCGSACHSNGKID